MSMSESGATPAVFRSQPSRLPRAWLAIALMSLSVLAACGFHLRGAYTLPYQLVYVASPSNTPLGNLLRLYIKASNSTKVTETRKDAEASIEVLSENRDQKILALNSQGRPREKELNYHFTFHVVRPSDDKELLAATTINLKRNVSYNETQELSSASQEEMLYKDMQSDAVQQLMRRLSSITTEEAAQAARADGQPVQTVPTTPVETPPPAANGALGQ